MKNCLQTRNSGRGSQAGWTLLELMMAVIVITIALVAYLVFYATSIRVTATSHQMEVAMNAVRGKLEEMNSAYDTLIGTFTHYTTTLGGGLGPTFTVWLDQAEGIMLEPDPAGEVVFPTVGGQLREDSGGTWDNMTGEEAARLGMPRDINGDGVVDTNDHSSDTNLQILPMLVRVTWQDGAGEEWVVEEMALRRRK